MTFLACTVFVMVMLSVVNISFTPVWLLPIGGGMLVGIALVSLNRLLRHPAARSGRLSQEYVEASVQLVLGLAILVVGFYSV